MFEKLKLALKSPKGDKIKFEQDKTNSSRRGSVSFADDNEFKRLRSSRNSFAKQFGRLNFGSNEDLDASNKSTTGSTFYRLPTVIRKKKRSIIMTPKREKQIIDHNKKMLKLGKCIEFSNDEIIGKGGFGVTAKKDGYIHKIIKDFAKSYYGVLEDGKWTWIYNRYINFCKDMFKYTTKSLQLFPENFVKIGKDDCGYCLHNDKTALYVRMPVIKNMISGDMKSNMFKISKKELNLLIAQIFYISMVSNMKELHHNDLKPANIVIKKAEKDFEYSGLKIDNFHLKIKIKKDELIPVFIDYDLISFVNIQDKYNYHDFPASGSSSDDFEYFILKSREYARSKNKNINDMPLFNLPKNHEKINSNTLNNFVEYLDMTHPNKAYISMIGGPTKQVMGGRRRTKKKTKSKKIRKHSGVNQQTGRLKKGYKYSGKKLKSGLPQIVKISKKK